MTEELRAWIAKAPFRFARTMPENLTQGGGAGRIINRKPTGAAGWDDE